MVNSSKSLKVMCICFLFYLFSCAHNPPSKILLDPVQRITVIFHNNEYEVLTIDLKTTELKLYWKINSNKAFRSAGGLERILKRKKRTLLAAFNAGLFTAEGNPRGWHIERGLIIHKPDDSEIEGPNRSDSLYHGVFFSEKNSTDIVSVQEFSTMKKDSMEYASQGEQILVKDGKIPDGISDSDTVAPFRSGIGILIPEKIVYVLARNSVSLQEFSTFFLDYLETQNALHLRKKDFLLYSPLLELNYKSSFPGMFGIVKKKEY